MLQTSLFVSCLFNLVDGFLHCSEVMVFCVIKSVSCLFCQLGNSWAWLLECWNIKTKLSSSQSLDSSLNWESMFYFWLFPSMVVCFWLEKKGYTHTQPKLGALIFVHVSSKTETKQPHYKVYRKHRLSSTAPESGFLEMFKQITPYMHTTQFQFNFPFHQSTKCCHKDTNDF